MHTISTMTVRDKGVNKSEVAGQQGQNLAIINLESIPTCVYISNHSNAQRVNFQIAICWHAKFWLE